MCTLKYPLIPNEYDSWHSDHWQSVLSIFLSNWKVVGEPVVLFPVLLLNTQKSI